MASMLLSQLPKPVKEYEAPSSPTSTDSSLTTLTGRTAKQPPPYGSLDRKRYVPRKAEDFGDGGVQFPVFHSFAACSSEVR